MNTHLDALGVALSLGRAHASLTLRLEEELGAFHGMNYGDFALLYMLASSSDGRLPMPELARMLGLSVFALTRQMVSLEKIGLAAREPATGDSGGRYAAIRPGGKRRVHEATDTAAALCAEALRPIGQASMSGVRQALSAICGDEPATA